MKDLKAVYYALALAAMTLFTQTCLLAGDTNLPPQKGLARLIINVIFIHAIAIYVWLFAGSGAIRLKRAHWILFGVVGLILCTIPPVFSGDLHEYLMRGRIVGVYHDQPYVVPRAYPGDPFYSLSVWVRLNKLPENYGPLWVWVQSLAPTLFRHSYVLSVFFFKLVLFGFFAGAVWIFRGIAGRLAPDKTEWLTAFFALNPNLISHTLIDGHNDIVMVFLMLASFYLMIKGRDAWSVVFATFAVLIKFTAVFLLPVVVIYALKNKRALSLAQITALVARSAFLFFAISAALYAPFWVGPGTLGYFSTFGHWFASNSVPYAVWAGLSRLGVSIPQGDVKQFFNFFFAANVLAALAWFSFRREVSAKDAAAALSWIFLAMYSSYTIPFYGHHLLWAFGFMLLAQWPAPVLWGALYTASGVFFYFKRLSVLFVASIVVYVSHLIFRHAFRPWQVRTPLSVKEP